MADKIKKGGANTGSQRHASAEARNVKISDAEAKTGAMGIDPLIRQSNRFKPVVTCAR